MIYIVGEEWKSIALEIDFETNGTYDYEVSNLGRVKRLYKGKENLIKGSFHDGYRILKLKLIEKRKPEIEQKLLLMRNEIADLKKMISSDKQLIKSMDQEHINSYEIRNRLHKNSLKYDGLLDKYKTYERKERLKRTRNLSLLVHRMVAIAFCEKKNETQNFVLHKDHNKLNNHFENLVWCNTEELAEHWKSNPNMQQEYTTRKGRRNLNSEQIKLTIPKVMLIKKMLSENAPLSKVAKIFKITSTQVKRIKTGENWGDIAPAE